MKWSQTTWPFLRDVVITGTAVASIWLQLALWAAMQRQPSTPLLGTAFGLLVPSAAAHVRNLLRSAGSSSESSPPPSSPPLPQSPLPEVGSGD